MNSLSIPNKYRTSLLSHQPGNNTFPGIPALILVRTTSPLPLKSAAVTILCNLGGRLHSPTRRPIGRPFRKPWTQLSPSGIATLQQMSIEQMLCSLEKCN